MTEKKREKEWIFIVGKCIKYYLRRLVKFFSIVTIGLFIIASFIYIKYKPLYKVTLNGEVIGYVESREQMQEKIEAFENNLEGNITSITIEAMPEYELELVSNVSEAETVEEEVLARIEENSTIMCKTYAITFDGVEKTCVNSMEEAEKVVEDIKADVEEGVELNLEIVETEKEKSETDANTSTVEVAKLALNEDVENKVEEYEKEQASARAAAASRAAASATTTTSSSSTATTSSAGSSITATGALFMRPVVGGTISSVYGQRSSGFHTGLDIALSSGTPIYAAASGTVTFSGTKGSYGKLVIIDHGNGYVTYYAHCSALYVTAGQTVSQGDNISAVGSTGNSTGPHLHFEIRYNGSTLNPQNYI